jgi:hypothetical protein
MQTREVIPTPLENAMLATRVIAALHAVDAGITTPLVEGAFGEAGEFLHSVNEGKLFAKQRKVTEKSARYALAYGEAVRAIGTLRAAPVMSEDEATVFADLVHTIERLRDGVEVSKDEREIVRRFFTFLRDVFAQANPRPIEAISISR